MGTLRQDLRYSVTVLLLAILPAFPQDRQPAGGCRLETKYDRFTDTTTVQCDLIETYEAPQRLSVQANASFRGKESGGKEPNETVKCWLYLSLNRGGATRRTQPLFQDAATLYLLTDSAQLEIPVNDYHHTYFELARSFAESARADPSHDDLRKLLTAKSLKGKWGDVEFNFSDAVLASLKNFISRQVFAAHTRSQ